MASAALLLVWLLLSLLMPTGRAERADNAIDQRDIASEQEHFYHTMVDPFGFTTMAYHVASLMAELGSHQILHSNPAFAERCLNNEDCDKALAGHTSSVARKVIGKYIAYLDLEKKEPRDVVEVIVDVADHAMAMSMGRATLLKDNFGQHGAANVQSRQTGVSWAPTPILSKDEHAIKLIGQALRWEDKDRVHNMHFKDAMKDDNDVMYLPGPQNLTSMLGLESLEKAVKASPIYGTVLPLRLRENTVYLTNGSHVSVGPVTFGFPAMVNNITFANNTTSDATFSNFTVHSNPVASNSSSSNGTRANTDPIFVNPVGSMFMENFFGLDQCFGDSYLCPAVDDWVGLERSMATLTFLRALGAHKVLKDEDPFKKALKLLKNPESGKLTTYNIGGRNIEIQALKHFPDGIFAPHRRKAAEDFLRLLQEEAEVQATTAASKAFVPEMRYRKEGFNKASGQLFHLTLQPDHNQDMDPGLKALGYIRGRHLDSRGNPIEGFTYLFQPSDVRPIVTSEWGAIAVGTSHGNITQPAASDQTTQHQKRFPLKDQIPTPAQNDRNSAKSHWDDYKELLIPKETFAGIKIADPILNLYVLKEASAESASVLSPFPRGLSLGLPGNGSVQVHDDARPEYIGELMMSINASFSKARLSSNLWDQANLGLLNNDLAWAMHELYVAKGPIIAPREDGQIKARQGDSGSGSPFKDPTTTPLSTEEQALERARAEAWIDALQRQSPGGPPVDPTRPETPIPNSIEDVDGIKFPFEYGEVESGGRMVKPKGPFGNHRQGDQPYHSPYEKSGRLRYERFKSNKKIKAALQKLKALKHRALNTFPIQKLTGVQVLPTMWQRSADPLAFESPGERRLGASEDPWRSGAFQDEVVQVAQGVDSTTELDSMRRPVMRSSYVDPGTGMPIGQPHMLSSEAVHGTNGQPVMSGGLGDIPHSDVHLTVNNGEGRIVAGVDRPGAPGKIPWRVAAKRGFHGFAGRLAPKEVGAAVRAIRVVAQAETVVGGAAAAARAGVAVLGILSSSEVGAAMIAVDVALRLVNVFQKDETCPREKYYDELWNEIIAKVSTVVTPCLPTEGPKHHKRMTSETGSMAFNEAFNPSLEDNNGTSRNSNCDLIHLPGTPTIPLRRQETIWVSREHLARRQLQPDATTPSPASGTIICPSDPQIPGYRMVWAGGRYSGPDGPVPNPGFACPIPTPIECHPDWFHDHVNHLPAGVQNPLYCKQGDLAGHYRALKAGCLDLDSLKPGINGHHDKNPKWDHKVCQKILGIDEDTLEWVGINQEE